MDDITDNQYHRDCFFDSGNENWDWQNLSKKSHNNITNGKELSMQIETMKIGDVYYEKHTVISVSKRTNTVSETDVEIVNVLPIDVLDKIIGYIDYIRNTGMGKKKSLEFIEKFIEGLKVESEE